jgi:hypothetical protein
VGTYLIVQEMLETFLTMLDSKMKWCLAILQLGIRIGSVKQQHASTFRLVMLAGMVQESCVFLEHVWPVRRFIAGEWFGSTELTIQTLVIATFDGMLGSS